jgi:hypothetical protein
VPELITVEEINGKLSQMGSLESSGKLLHVEM